MEYGLGTHSATQDASYSMQVSGAHRHRGIACIQTVQHGIFHLPHKYHKLMATVGWLGLKQCNIGYGILVFSWGYGFYVVLNNKCSMFNVQ